MREIKFKGKRVDNGEWAYGGYCLDAGGIPRITTVDSSGQGLIFNKVLPETVGQLTPFKDSEGKKIYEGDTIKDVIVGMESEIVFTDYGNFGLKSKSIDFLEYDTIDPAWTETTVLITGNIHENQNPTT